MKNRQPDPLWEVLDRKVVYKSPPWVELSVETVRTDSGRIVEDYHQLRLPDFVVVVAETPDNRVLCLRQYKHGLGQVSLTFPGGMVDAGEKPERAIRRELLEETGYTAKTWCHLGSFTVHGNLGAGRGHFYRAEGVCPARKPASGDLEWMELEMKTWEELSLCLQAGEIKLLNHIAALSLAAPYSIARGSGTQIAAQ